MKGRERIAWEETSTAVPDDVLKERDGRNNGVAGSGGKEKDVAVARRDDATRNQPGKEENGVLPVRWMMERRMGRMKE